MNEQPKPSIGRIVIYHSTTGEELPAIVRAVQGGTLDLVSLTVFDAFGDRRYEGVPRGDYAATWSWPVRT